MISKSFLSFFELLFGRPQGTAYSCGARSRSKRFSTFPNTTTFIQAELSVSCFALDRTKEGPNKTQPKDVLITSGEPTEELLSCFSFPVQGCVVRYPRTATRLLKTSLLLLIN